MTAPPTTPTHLLCQWRHGIVHRRDALKRCPLCHRKIDDGFHVPHELPTTAAPGRKYMWG